MAGTLAAPTADVSVNGVSIPFSELRVTQSRTKRGDTFHVETGLSDVDLSWWLTQAPIPVVISINGTQIFNGNVDSCSAEFHEQSFEFSGRDAASVLMETQTSEKFLNRKPEDIVQAIAARHGIQAEIDSTSSRAGKIYTVDHDSLSHRGSEWSYINDLADHYGMIAYMTGGKLYFKRYDEQLPVYRLTYAPPSAQSYADGNFVRLKASRNHILGRPIKVNVHSHNHRQKKVYSATATSAFGTGTPLVYNKTIAGISQGQAQTIATAKLAEIQAHELTIDELELPGDETINARMQFELTGTNSPLDQTYEATQIEHVFSVREGYRTGISIKNRKKGGASAEGGPVRGQSVRPGRAASGGNAPVLS